MIPSPQTPSRGAGSFFGQLQPIRRKVQGRVVIGRPVLGVALKRSDLVGYEPNRSRQRWATGTAQVLPNCRPSPDEARRIGRWCERVASDPKVQGQAAFGDLRYADEAAHREARRLVEAVRAGDWAQATQAFLAVEKLREEVVRHCGVLEGTASGVA